MAELIVAIEDNEQIGFSRGIKITEGYQSASISVSVKDGSRLTVKSDKQLLGVWYGLTIEPAITRQVVEIVEETI